MTESSPAASPAGAPPEGNVPDDTRAAASEVALPSGETASASIQPSSTPPPPSLKALLVGNLLALASFLWVDIDPLMQGLHQDDSPFRGTPYSSPWPFYALGLAAIAGIALVALYRLVRRGADPTDRAFRLLPIATIIFIATHLLFVRATQNPHLPPSMLVTGIFATTALTPLKSDDGLFPTTPRFYADALAETPPPYWRNGERLSRWNVLIRERCAGPIDTLPGVVEPGTLLVCLSEDRRLAWISAVGLSRDLVGEPALIYAHKKLLSAPLQIQKKASGANKTNGVLPESKAVETEPQGAK